MNATRHSFLVILALGAFSAGPTIAQKSAPPLRAQVRVTSNPEKATIHVDGKKMGITPYTVQNLRPGRHLFVLSKRGYGEHRKTLTIDGSQKTSLEADLRPDTGLVLIESSPAGATVSIDGADIGTTPVVAREISIGSHRAAFKLSGYFPSEKDFTIENRRPVSISQKLRSNQASVLVQSTPEGAAVTLDGIDHGTTPSSIDKVEAGPHTLTLTLKGYVDATTTIRLEASDAQETVNIALKAKPSSLRIESEPAGAKIYLDNEATGHRTPYTLRTITPGSHRIRIELAKYDLMARTVEIKPGVASAEEFRLIGDTGLLQLITRPARCTVYVDGRRVGITATEPGGDVSEPFEMNLGEGEHEIKISKKGYATRAGNVNIERKKTANFNITLKREFIMDTVIELKSGPIFEGVLHTKSDDGSYRLEINEGVIKKFRPEDVKSLTPLVN